MESRNLLAQSATTSPKPEVRPQLQTLQEDNSSDVSALLREAYKERQQSLQTQLDKALAELHDIKTENKRLSTENQTQQRSISQLKIALEAKREHDNSLIQLNNQLNVANSSLAILNKEKKGWQEKLDSMQDKVIAAERQVRCLDHITRHKLESRQEAGYGQPKRRGQAASTPASTDVIGAMRALNEEIYQACVQFVEGLERTTLFSTIQKAQVQKVLGNHLTAMMEDQAKRTTSGYNVLLMQTVLEVFMTHWCSSIIEAFYPQQESFADLLVQLSAQTTYTSGK
jgi:chromosome segregation ATPase